MNSVTIKRVAAALSSILIVSGCAAPGGGVPVAAPVSGGRVGCGMQETGQNNNVAVGAASGAAVGAAIGALTGNHKTKNLATGVLAGALVGGAIGAYMDQQETALRQSLANSGIDMARSGDAIILTLREGILFSSGKSALSPQAKQGLDRLVDPLQKYDKTVITVCGHTDSVGSKDLNFKLSSDRAKSVSDYLVMRGVSPMRVRPIGMADDYPLADNGSNDGRAKNRRVEIVLRPTQG